MTKTKSDWFKMYDDCYKLLNNPMRAKNGFINHFIKYYNQALEIINQEKLIVYKDVLFPLKSTCLTLCKNKSGDCNCLMLSKVIDRKVITTGVYGDDEIIFGGYLKTKNFVLSEESIIKLLEETKKASDKVNVEINKLKECKSIGTNEYLMMVNRLVSELLNNESIVDKLRQKEEIIIGVQPVNDWVSRIDDAVFNQGQIDAMIDLGRLLQVIKH